MVKIGRANSKGEVTHGFKATAAFSRATATAKAQELHAMEHTFCTFQSFAILFLHK